LTDWTLPVNLLPEVAQAVAKLSQGKFTQQAVHSALGWHILQLEDARVFKAPSQEDLKGQLNQILARRVLEVRLKSLRDLAKVQ
jgi:peptidyl-prolyl cis-trans isomerase C